MLVRKVVERAAGRQDGDTFSVVDCEIRDFDKFALLPASVQHAVLEVMRSGKVPADLQALMKRLKEAGIVVCT